MKAEEFNINTIVDINTLEATVTVAYKGKHMSIDELIACYCKSHNGLKLAMTDIAKLGDEIETQAAALNKLKKIFT